MTAISKLKTFEARERKVGETSDGARRAPASKLDDLLAVVFVAMLLMWVVSTLAGPIRKTVTAYACSRSHSSHHLVHHEPGRLVSHSHG
jgi:hypothetical protein